MNISARVKKYCDKFILEPEDVAYADLIHDGWNKSEAAYFVFHLSYFDIARINSWLNERLRVKPGIMRMVAELEMEDAEAKRKMKELEEKAKGRQAKLDKDAKKNKETTEESLRTKAGMLEYLIDLAATPGLDLRTKADLAKQITDLQNYKKEEIKEEDTRIHFYLPLTCAKCELYKNHKQRKKEDNTNESESTQGNCNKTD